MEETQGGFVGLTFYKVRAAFNWDRGCYYMEVKLSDEQIDTLKKLLIENRDWIGGKEYIENLTGRNFETETGYENPFDPDWEPDFGPQWERNREIWLKRAGLR